MNPLFTLLTENVSITGFWAFAGSAAWMLAVVFMVRNSIRQKFVEIPAFLILGILVVESLCAIVLWYYGALSVWMRFVFIIRIGFDIALCVVALKYIGSRNIGALMQNYLWLFVGSAVIVWSAVLFVLVFVNVDVVSPLPQQITFNIAKAWLLLSIIIAVSYLWGFAQLHQQQALSKTVAASKMLGNALLAWSIYRAFPSVGIAATGILLVLTDSVYLVLLVQFSRKTRKISLQREDYVFPTNPRFEKLWAENPDYFDCFGVRLRKLELPEYSFVKGDFSHRSFVLEGTIKYDESHGEITWEVFGDMIQMNDAIKEQMGWKDDYVLNNTLSAKTVDRKVVQRAVELLRERRERGEDVHTYLIASDITRILHSLSRRALPKVFSTWHLFPSVEEACAAMLNTYFRRTSAAFSASSLVADLREKMTVPSQPLSYHGQRIEQLYTILAKIESYEVEDIPSFNIPPDDMYSDIFRALELVLEDKKRQIAKAVLQTQELERQAIEIQMANNQLSQQNQELLALNHEKNELMGIVSHDLKNPIGALRNFAEMLEHGYITGDKVTSVAGKMIVTADRMLDLVKNLLELNRFEQGSVSMTMFYFSLVTLIDSMLWQHESIAKAKDIAIIFTADNGVHEVCADEQMMIQILDNLLSNAVKYSPFGTTIRVRVLSVNGMVRVEIQDEGPGISAEDMQKLFGKFARLSAQPTGGEHSTGLGLSIVKKMVEAMNGRVWCESELGKGATFIVELPCA